LGPWQRREFFVQASIGFDKRRFITATAGADIHA